MIKVILAVGIVLLILKLVGVAQIAWWMVIVPFALLLLAFIFLVVMVSPYGTLIAVSMMQKGHEANKRRLAKEAAKNVK